MISVISAIMGGAVAILLMGLAVFATPGSTLIQLVSLNADGRHGVLVRTVLWSVIGDWSYEIEADDGTLFCHREGQQIFEERGEKPVVFPLSNGCTHLEPGEYHMRVAVSPLAFGVNLRPTVIDTHFVVTERDALP